METCRAAAARPCLDPHLGYQPFPELLLDTHSLATQGAQSLERQHAPGARLLRPGKESDGETKRNREQTDQAAAAAVNVSSFGPLLFSPPKSCCQ